VGDGHFEEQVVAQESEDEDADAAAEREGAPPPAVLFVAQVQVLLNDSTFNNDNQEDQAGQVREPENHVDVLRALNSGQNLVELNRDHKGRQQSTDGNRDARRQPERKDDFGCKAVDATSLHWRHHLGGLETEVGAKNCGWAVNEEIEDRDQQYFRHGHEGRALSLDPFAHVNNRETDSHEGRVRNGSEEREIHPVGAVPEGVEFGSDEAINNREAGE